MQIELGADQPITSTLLITSTSEVITWTATLTPSVSWAVLSASQGTTPESAVEVQLAPTGLAAGSYQTTLELWTAHPDVPNRRITIPVRLSVKNPPPPQIPFYLPLVARAL